MARVATFQIEVPFLTFFPVRYTQPLPQGLYTEFDREACPFTVKDPSGASLDTQWEEVSRYADGSLAVVEIIAAANNVGDFMQDGSFQEFELHDEKNAFGPGYNDNFQAFVQQFESVALRVRDQYGTTYRASLAGKLNCCPLLGVHAGPEASGSESDTNPQDDVIRFHRRGKAMTTVEIPVMMRPEAGAPQTAISNMGHVSFYVTFMPSMSPIVGFDFSWSATVAGGPQSPKDERQWNLYYDALELEHPPGWQLEGVVDEFWSGATYAEGDIEVTPIVDKHYAVGVVQLSGAANEFVPAGYQLEHNPSGKVYVTRDPVTLNSSGSGFVRVRSVARGDSSYDRAFGDQLVPVTGGVFATCNDSDYQGIKYVYHVLGQFGERAWRYALALPTPDAQFQAEQYARGWGWGVCRPPALGSGWSWQSQGTAALFAQCHLAPDLDYLPTLGFNLEGFIDNRWNTMSARIEAGLGGSQLGFWKPSGSTGFAESLGGNTVDGPYNPATSEQGGATSSNEISPWGGVEDFWAGKREGMLWWMMWSRCYKDRCRTTVMERDGRAFDSEAYGGLQGGSGWSVFNGAFRHQPNHWDFSDVNFTPPDGTQIDGRHEAKAFADKRFPPYWRSMTQRESPENIPVPPQNFPFGQGGGGYNNIWSSHLIRYVHTLQALVWLCNDPIGKRWIQSEAEIRRMEFTQDSHFSTLSGVSNLGGGFGRDKAWMTHLQATAYAIRQDESRVFGGAPSSVTKSWCETLVQAVDHVQMPNGIWLAQKDGKPTTDFPVGELRTVYPQNYPFGSGGGSFGDAHQALQVPIPPTPARIAGTGSNAPGSLIFDITAPNTVPAGTVFSRQVGNDLLFYITTETSFIDGSGQARAAAQAWGSSSDFQGVDTLEEPFTNWPQACAFHGYSPCTPSNTYLEVSATGGLDPFGDPEFELVKPPQDVTWRGRVITTNQPIQFTSNAFELELVVKSSPGVGGLWPTGENVFDSHWSISFWKDINGTEAQVRPNFSFVAQVDGSISLRGFGGGASVPPSSQWGTVEALSDGWHRIRVFASAASSAVGTELLPCVTAGQELRVGDSAFVLIQPARFDAHPSIPGSQFPNTPQSPSERRLLISKIAIRNLGVSSLDGTGDRFNIGYNANPSFAPEFDYIGRATPSGGGFGLPLDLNATVPTLASAKTRAWPGIVGGSTAHPAGSPSGVKAWGGYQDNIDLDPNPSAHNRGRAAVARPNEFSYMLHALRGIQKSVLDGVSSVDALCKRVIKRGGRGMWRVLWKDENLAQNDNPTVSGQTWDHVVVRHYCNADVIPSFQDQPGRYSVNQTLGDPAFAAPSGNGTPYIMVRASGFPDQQLEFAQSAHAAMGLAPWHAYEDGTEEVAGGPPAPYPGGFFEVQACVRIVRQGAPAVGNPSLPLVVLQQEGFEFLRNTAGLIALLQAGLQVTPGTEV